jgi:hypothetical protein
MDLAIRRPEQRLAAARRAGDRDEEGDDTETYLMQTQKAKREWNGEKRRKTYTERAGKVYLT